MLKTLRVITQSFALIFIVGNIISCASTDRNADTPEGAFALAEEFEKSDRYEEALRRYSEVKNKYPYSNYATKAELAIADVYYKQESYGEAQLSYQMFKELHPTAANIDYVQYKIGMSYFMQLPSTIDRDLTLANDTIVQFSELIKKYPNSEHIKDAQEKRTKAVKMLAEKEEYIADFYFKRKIFESALSRYEGLYNKFRGLGFDAKALSRASISAHRIGDTTKAKKYEEVLAKDFPNSSELKAAMKEIE